MEFKLLGKVLDLYSHEIEIMKVVIKFFSKLYEEFNISALCHLVIDKEGSRIISVYSVPYFCIEFPN